MKQYQQPTLQDVNKKLSVYHFENYQNDINIINRECRELARRTGDTIASARLDYARDRAIERLLAGQLEPQSTCKKLVGHTLPTPDKPHGTRIYKTMPISSHARPDLYRIWRIKGAVRLAATQNLARLGRVSTLSADDKILLNTMAQKRKRWNESVKRQRKTGGYDKKYLADTGLTPDQLDNFLDYLKHTPFVAE